MKILNISSCNVLNAWSVAECWHHAYVFGSCFTSSPPCFRVLQSTYISTNIFYSHAASRRKKQFRQLHLVVHWSFPGKKSPNTDPISHMKRDTHQHLCIKNSTHSSGSSQPGSRSWIPFFSGPSSKRSRSRWSRWAAGRLSSSFGAMSASGGPSGSSSGWSRRSYSLCTPDNTNILNRQRHWTAPHAPVQMWLCLFLLCSFWGKQKIPMV